MKSVIRTKQKRDVSPSPSIATTVSTTSVGSAVTKLFRKKIGFSSKSKANKKSKTKSKNVSFVDDDEISSVENDNSAHSFPEYNANNNNNNNNNNENLKSSALNLLSSSQLSVNSIHRRSSDVVISSSNSLSSIITSIEDSSDGGNPRKESTKKKTKFVSFASAFNKIKRKKKNNPPQITTVDIPTSYVTFADQTGSVKSVGEMQMKIEEDQNDETDWPIEDINKKIIERKNWKTNNLVANEENEEKFTVSFENKIGIDCDNNRTKFDSEIDTVPSPEKSIVSSSEIDGSQTKRNLSYKILVVGELGSGKTSIINRYVHKFFSEYYRSTTIGVDFSSKIIPWDDDIIITLQLWDTAGQEQFMNLLRAYYKDANGAFVVFDSTHPNTLDEAVLKWKKNIEDSVHLTDRNTIPCILLANKCDQLKKGVINDRGKMDQFCKEHKFLRWFETSAKSNINIDEAVKTLIAEILQNGRRNEVEEKMNDVGIILDDNKSSKMKEKTCGCG